MNRHHLITAILLAFAPIAFAAPSTESADIAARWAKRVLAISEEARKQTDGQPERATSPVLTGTGEAFKFTVDVAGWEDLWLVADVVDNYNHDQAIWGEPVLVAADGSRTSLVDLKPATAKVGWGKLVRDLDHRGKPLTVKGQVFKKGYFAHAGSQLQFKLNRKYKTFETLAGVGESAGKNGTVRFIVSPALKGESESDRKMAALGKQIPALKVLSDMAARGFVGKAPEAAAAFARKAVKKAARRRKRWSEEVARLAEAKASPAEWLQLAAESTLTEKRWADTQQTVGRLNIPALQRAVRDLAATFPGEYPKGAEYLAELAAARRGLKDILARLDNGDEEAFEAAGRLLALREEALLANPLLSFERLLLVRRKASNLGMPANWQSNSMLRRTGYDNDIAIMSPVRPGAPLKTLYRPDDDTFVGDVDLHFDADRMLLSKSHPKGAWQVYEVRADGTGLRQVTPDAQGYNNYDACYLPNGEILYTSTAPMVAVPCVYGSTPVANIFRLGTDGKTARQLCFDQEHNWCPTVLNSGRILYLRWEYADLPHSNSRILFHMAPDGTSQMEYYGSNSYWPNGVFYAKPIPGHPTRVVGIVTGHHGARREGELLVLDPALGRREADGAVQRIPGYGQPVEPLCRDRLIDSSWPRFLHPHPLGRDDGRGSGKYFLVSAKLTNKSAWGIYLVDVFDNMLLLREEPGYALLEAVPFEKRQVPPIVPDKVDTNRQDALVYVSDLHAGAGLAGVPKGSVKELRVFTYTYGYRGFGGLYGSIGMDGPWDMRRVLGTVPVEADGSAFFRVPANVPIAVQPLDDQGRALQLMRSWFTAMPGEVLSCVGCHETQSQSPPPRPTMAAGRAPADLTDWLGRTRNFAFEREVQPLLTRHCVKCHNGQTTWREKPLFSLRDEPMKGKWRSSMHGHVNANHGGRFSEAYRNLHRYVRHPGIESDIHMLPPMDYHADSTELIQVLKKGHHGVRLAANDWQRLYTWIDFNTPFHGEWSTIVGDGAIQREKERAEMRRLYANVNEDHEQHDPPPENKEPEFLAAVPEVPPAVLPALEIRARAAGLLGRRRTIDLGGGARMTLVYVPPGEFVMGSAGGHPDARPPHMVRIEKGFWMAETETTNLQFGQFDPGHDSRRESKQGYQFGVKGYRLDEPAQPVVRVSWERATAFCRWLSERTGLPVRLPSERQWEYACRGDTRTEYSFGDGPDFSAHANMADATLSDFAGNPYKDYAPYKKPSEFDDWIPKCTSFNDGGFVSMPVGSYEANPWGLYDMHGNVWEWTRSAFVPYPKHEDGDAAGERVVRGGSWRDRPHRCSSAYRLSFAPHQPVFSVGFRIVIESDALEPAPASARGGSFCEARDIVVADNGLRKLIRFGPDGQVKWEHPDVNCYDIQLLENGNMLFVHSDAKRSRIVELSKGGEVAWEYSSKGEVFSCQRLPNGNTLIGECSAGRLVEVTPDGEVAVELPLTFNSGGRNALRKVRKLPDGGYLAAHPGDKCVREYSAKGDLLQEFPAPYLVSAFTRLANGHTLVASDQAVIEYDSEARSVWSLFNDEIPGVKLVSVSAVEQLPNGNLLLANWLGNKKEGQALPIFEITRNKRLVWALADTEQTKWVTDVEVAQ
jgi:formylglycine-generating enzyme required for sulfatase activity